MDEELVEKNGLACSGTTAHQNDAASWKPSVQSFVESRYS
jgi:hypothetical protein